MPSKINTTAVSILAIMLALLLTSSTKAIGAPQSTIRIYKYPKPQCLGSGAPVESTIQITAAEKSALSLAITNAIDLSVPPKLAIANRSIDRLSEHFILDHLSCSSSENFVALQTRTNWTFQLNDLSYALRRNDSHSIRPSIKIAVPSLRLVAEPLSVGSIDSILWRVSTAGESRILLSTELRLVFLQLAIRHAPSILKGSWVDPSLCNLAAESFISRHIQELWLDHAAQSRVKNEFKAISASFLRCSDEAGPRDRLRLELQATSTRPSVQFLFYPFDFVRGGLVGDLQAFCASLDKLDKRIESIHFFREWRNTRANEPSYAWLTPSPSGLANSISSACIAFKPSAPFFTLLVLPTEQTKVIVSCPEFSFSPTAANNPIVGSADKLMPMLSDGSWKEISNGIGPTSNLLVDSTLSLQRLRELVKGHSPKAFPVSSS